MRAMRSSRPASVALQALLAVLISALVRPPVWAAAPTHVARLVLAASGPKVAVVVISQDAKAAPQQGALEGAAEAALVRAARFDVLSVQDAFNPDRAQERAASLENAQKRIKEGTQAIEDLDSAKAIEAFTQALDGLKAADLSDDFSPLIDTWTMKAAGFATSGDTASAKKEIEAIVGVQARAVFSTAYFPPELIKFAEAQKRLAANAKGELLVRTEPAGARVWIDGTYRGLSPVTVTEMTSAKHFVTAALGGYALSQSQVTPGEQLVSLQPAQLGDAWKNAVANVTKDPEGPLRDSSAQALGTAAGLDQVLLVLAKKSLAGEQLDLVGLRLETKDGHNDAYKAATVATGDPESMAAFFDALAGADTPRDGKDPVHHFKGAQGASGRTVAGLSLLGVGVVGAASWITFGVLALGRADAFHQTPQTRTVDSDLLRQSGQTYALVADVSWIVGLLAAGTGAVLLFTRLGLSSAPESDQDRKAREAKKLEDDRRAAEERRAADERAKEDDRQREEDRRREDEKKRAAEKKAADDKAAEDEKKKADDEKANKKLSKKEREALEKKERAEEAERKKQEAADAKKQAAEEAERKKQEAAKKQAEEDDARKKEDASQAKKADDEEAAKKRAEEAEAAAAQKREEEAARRKKEEEERKRKEAERRKKEEEDDLRNY